MQQNPYVTLGISENATEQEVYEAYRSLREKYERERFLEGEEGAEAARKLSEVYDAYDEIMGDRMRQARTPDEIENFDGVREAIKAYDLARAQSLLDDYTNRSAEWHYLQAKIFYDKEWRTEAKKQLEIANQMDPDNQKYKGAYERLKKESKGSFVFGTDEKEKNDGTHRSYGPSASPMNGEANNFCNCCSSLICADCCCECMGGDLITCC